MKITKKVKKYGNSYIIAIDKSFIDDGVLDVNTYYSVTIEQCHQ